MTFQPRELIREIKCRPPIYNREIIAPPRRDHVRKLWLEVAVALTPEEDWEQYTDVEKDARVDELQLKWKHLKNHFHRELKLIDAGEAHKKRKYIYFDDMEFMRPFVGYTLAPLRFDKHPSDLVVEETIIEENVDNNSDIDMEALLKTAEIIEEVDEIEEPVEEPQQNVRPKRNIKPTIKVVQKPIQKPVQKPSTPKIQNKVPLKKSTPSAPKINTPSGAGNNASFKIRDGDISFTLSLVPTLRKLGDSKKLRAKIEILKILHKFAGTAENSHYLNRSGGQNNNSSKNNDENEEDSDMQEDHLEELEEGGTVHVKNEDNDPLHGNKTWWT